jgi:hypothetical protein
MKRDRNHGAIIIITYGPLKRQFKKEDELIDLTD